MPKLSASLPVVALLLLSSQTARAQQQLQPGMGLTASSSASTALDRLVKKFAQSMIIFSTSTDLKTIDKNTTYQVDNPMVSSNLLLIPSFDLPMNLRLAASVGLDYEYTNSDLTTYINELVVSDTSVNLWWAGIPQLPWGTVVQVAGQAVLPTSKASQARGLNLAGGPRLIAFHSFQGVLGGRITLIGLANYRRTWSKSTTPNRQQPDQQQDPNQGPFPSGPSRDEEGNLIADYGRSCIGGSSSCDEQLVGATNLRDSLSWRLTVMGSWGIVRPSLSYGQIHQWTDTLEEVVSLEDPVNFDATNLRVLTSFSAAVALDVYPGLSPTINYSFTRNALNSDGQYGNPLWDTNRAGAMLFSVGLNIFPASLYAALAH